MERVGKEKDTRGKWEDEEDGCCVFARCQHHPNPIHHSHKSIILHCPWTVCSVHNHSHIFFFLFFFVPVVNINTVLADGINTQ